MNISLACQICTERYNLEEKKPRFLDCGHTFCTRCIKVLNSKPELMCPVCSFKFDHAESIERFKPTYFLINILTSIELNCTLHPKASAGYINKSTLSCLCDECAQEIPKSNLLDMEKEDITFWLKSEIIHMSSSDSIPDKTRNRIRMVDSLSNLERVELLKELKLSLNKLYCDRHPNVECYSYNLATFVLNCRACCDGLSKDVVEVADDFSYILIDRIISLRRFIEVLDIPEKLRLSLEALKALTLKDLIKFYASFNKLSLGSSAILKTIKCIKCNENYDSNNPPWILPCPGLHCVCNKCVENNYTIVCPLDNSENSKESLIEMFDSRRPSPKCNECKCFFDTKLKIPKECPCGYIICLECLRSDYILKNPGNCKHCLNKHDLSSLTTNEYFNKLIKNHKVYCLVHKNRSAAYIVLSTLQTLCEDCSQRTQEKKVKIDSEDFFISCFLSDFFKDKLNNPDFQTNCKVSIDEFASMSNQDKIDTIREGLKPEISDILRNKVPAGRLLKEKRVEGLSYLYRFYTVMPPLDFNPDKIFLSKPWVIESEKNQVEAVVFSCDSDIKLYGVGIGQALNFYESYVEFIEIRKGKNLSGEPAMKDYDKKPFGYTGEVEDVMFKAPFEVRKDTEYNIVVKIQGELLYRGNPFDLKEAMVGSDGVLFEFKEPENRGDYYVNGQHDINGPILKFIYALL
jgi:zinc-RING finger domain/PHR domain